jgi:hypothetical protein
LVISNSIIFIHTHRSTRRIHTINEDRAPAVTLRPRDARLLKHMIFMVVVFLSTWGPIYTIMAVNLSLLGNAFSPLGLQILLTMPSVGILINVVDLFLYNHELRKYFTNKWHRNPTITRARE